MEQNPNNSRNEEPRGKEQNSKESSIKNSKSKNTTDNHGVKENAPTIPGSISGKDSIRNGNHKKDQRRGHDQSPAESFLGQNSPSHLGMNDDNYPETGHDDSVYSSNGNSDSKTFPPSL